MKLQKTLSPLARLGAVGAIALLAAAAAPSANAATLLTYFNFNDSGAANGQPAAGPALVSDAPGTMTSTITTNFNNPVLDVTVGGGTTLNQAAGDATGAGQALTLRQGAAPGNNGHYIQFTMSTLGFSDLSLSYATTRTGSGFNSQALSYSTDGITFTPVSSFTAFSATAGTFVTASFDLTAINAIENQPTVTFRLTFAGASASAGTNSIDNLQVVAAVPEPATIFGGLLGLTGLCFHQRRRIVKAILPRVA